MQNAGSNQGSSYATRNTINNTTVITVHDKNQNVVNN